MGTLYSFSIFNPWGDISTTEVVMGFYWDGSVSLFHYGRGCLKYRFQEVVTTTGGLGLLSSC